MLKGDWKKVFGVAFVQEPFVYKSTLNWKYPCDTLTVHFVPNYYEREQPGANFDKLILFRRTMYKVSPDWSNKYHVTELSSPIGPYLHCPLE